MLRQAGVRRFPYYVGYLPTEDEIMVVAMRASMRAWLVGEDNVASGHVVASGHEDAFGCANERPHKLRRRRQDLGE